MFVFFVQLFVSCSKKTNNDETVIIGKIKGPIKDGDSIFFTHGNIDKKFFETQLVSSGIRGKKFRLKERFSYPHMYKVNLKSERNNIVFRGGVYFIDETTNSIEVDSLGAGECSNTSGQTYQEYNTRFLPFLFKDYDCGSNDLGRLVHGNGAKFDAKLLKYIKKYPDSFVALWFLIKRINLEGHKTLYENALQSFSEKMKNEKLWQLTFKDLGNIRIKQGHKFPKLKLKNIYLEEEVLKLPNAKYTLIDYWFSSCKPCLENFLALKQLYKEYKPLGFEIVGISVDRTENIDKWKEVIGNRELTWVQYLDENGKDAAKDKIHSFPTTFLLNENGEMVRKNISPTELKDFLKKNLID